MGLASGAEVLGRLIVQLSLGFPIFWGLGVRVPILGGLGFRVPIFRVSLPESLQADTILRLRWLTKLQVLARAPAQSFRACKIL